MPEDLAENMAKRLAAMIATMHGVRTPVTSGPVIICADDTVHYVIEIHTVKRGPA